MAGRPGWTTPAELLRSAADALEHDPSEDRPPAPMHPGDAWAAAASALEVVAGLQVSQHDTWWRSESYGKHARVEEADRVTWTGI